MTTFQLYTSVEHLPKDKWDGLINHDIFLQTQYLEAASNALPETILMCYVGVFKSNELVGVAVIQHVQLYVKDMFRQERATCFKELIQKQVSKFLKGNILVVGNLTHTGQHGLYFNKLEITQSEFLSVIFNAITERIKCIKNDFKKTIRLVLFKDYFENDTIHLEQHTFQSQGFYKLKVQPNMMMNVRNTWFKGEDYIADMTSKYRTRFNRARKKRNHIVSKELDLTQLKKESKTIYKLYKHVSDNAAFNTFVLPENHFWSLKEHLKDNFKVFGYYLKDELIGFYSLILNNDILETYFLGYDSEHQNPNQLYLNMLYDMAFYAVKNKFKTVVYARTAMEIKSSVGAKPEPMYMYLKYTNPFVNAILRQIFGLMDPSQDWEERHPFKT